jgi:putative ABC transport system permease protein
MRMIPPVISEIDSNLPVYKLETMRRVVKNNVYLDRMISLLSGGFAILALLLAGIGLYSVLSYNVTNRSREFGLRQALGAKPGNLRLIVFRQVAVVAGAGVFVGLSVALALGKVAESLLFGLTGHEPRILAVAVVVLCSFVALSAWVPAQRASRIAPMEALREE